MPRISRHARGLLTHASRLSFESLERRNLLATFSVTSVGDSGPGSLRQAILDANASYVASTIDFDIAAAGVRTIQPTSALPAVNVPLTIDGTTEPGYAGAPVVAIDGSNAGYSSGLTFSPFAQGSVVRGLAIERFTDAGISGNDLKITIQSNEIGVDPAGTPGAGNGTGILLSSLPGPGGVIGTGAVIADNVIAGNHQGVDLDATIGTLVTDNYIGTDPSGRTDLGNSLDGVFIESLSTGDAVTDNVIANNGKLAIEDDGEATFQSGNTLTNNGGDVANIVVTTSTTDITTSTGKIETVTYTLTNQGPHVATNVVFSASTGPSFRNIDLIQPPSSVLTQVGAETSPGGIIPAGADINSFTGSRLATFNSLVSGASAGVVIQILITGSGTDRLAASVSSDQPATNYLGSTSIVNFTATGSADLSVSALPPPPGARVGVPETFTYVITNRDPLYTTDAQFVLDFGLKTPITPTGVVTYQGSVASVPNTPGFGVYAGDLGPLAPGASAIISATIVPSQSGLIGATVSTYSTADVDPTPTNNIALAATTASDSPTVIGVQLLPATGSIDYVVLQFSTPVQKSQAQNVANYHLTTGATKSKISIRSATYIDTTDSVILTLSKPLLRPGSTIALTVGGPGTPGLKGLDGTKLFGGIYIATLTR